MSLFNYITLFLAIIFVALTYMYLEAHRNHVSYHHFQFKELPEGFKEIKIFFISDIHKRKVSQGLIDQIDTVVDLVIIGGDLLEKGVPLSQVKENILKLKKLGPVYFVWGNNDYETDYHALDALLLEQGVKILDNTAVIFESAEGDCFTLLGVDDVTLKRDRLELALQDGNVDGFKLLVSHSPAIQKKIDREDRISLVLSGHTHGGQIRLFGFGPYELGGYKKHENTSILTSNGYGTTGVPLRLGARAETHLILLTTKKETL